MLKALFEGFRKVRRSWGLISLLWIVNLWAAALLALPLATMLEDDLRHCGSAATMMYGFDYGWWSEWSFDREDWSGTFQPDVFGAGFVFKNVDLLLRGRLPAGALPAPEEPAPDSQPSSDPYAVILGLGLVYLLLQTFLAGGLLGVLRSSQGAWTLRGLVHGSGFYFGRLFRVWLLALVALVLLFSVNVPVARWVQEQAREAVSESTASAWLLGHQALLLLAILFINMLSSYAKVIVVLEERSSAILAFVSSLAFCFGNLLRTAGHYLCVGALGVVLIVVWSSLDSRWETTGFKTQIVTLLLAQGLVVATIWLRLALLGGQVELFWSRSRSE